MFRKVTLSAFLLLLAVCAQAADPSALEIMRRNDRVRRVADERVRIRMSLINSRGKTQTRELVKISRSLPDGEEQTYIRFDAPPDIRRTSLLTLDREGKADDRWLYLPGLRKTRRISSSDKKDSFMGTDFSYEDLENEDLAGFDYQVTGSEAVDGAACWIIRAVPVSAEEKRDSGYASRDLWIRKDNAVLVRAALRDRSGRPAKEFKAGDIRQVAPGVWRAHSMEMRNLATGHRTVLAFHSFEINRGVEDETFTLRHLERPD